MDNKVSVEVVYATPEKQSVLTLSVMLPCTILSAINQSPIQILYPEIDLSRQRVGIFGHKIALTEQVKAGDRIEIYRPLQVDPKTARKLRTRF